METFVQMFAFFVLMVVGLFAVKLKIFSQESIARLTQFVLSITLPAFLITSLQRPFSHELFGSFLITLGVSTIFYAAMFFLAVLLTIKTPLAERSVYMYALVFSNSGFIGLPVIRSLLGSDALFIGAVQLVIFNVMSFTLGIFILIRYRPAYTSNDAASLTFSFIVKKMINPVIIAALIGLILFLSSVKIPALFLLPIQYVGGLTTPLSMIITGAMLATIPVSSVSKNMRVYLFSFYRLIGIPIITAGLLYLARVPLLVRQVLIIVAAMPVAANSGLLAETYGGDRDTITALILVSTVFSIITISVLGQIL